MLNHYETNFHVHLTGIIRFNEFSYLDQTRGWGRVERGGVESPFSLQKTTYFS